MDDFELLQQGFSAARLPGGMLLTAQLAQLAELPVLTMLLEGGYFLPETLCLLFMMFPFFKARANL